MTVKLLNDVELSDGESLYIIVRTAPSELPNGPRDHKTYRNLLKSFVRGANQQTHTPADKLLNTTGGIFKELYKTAERYSDSNGNPAWNDITVNRTTLKSEESWINDNGTYIFWEVNINYTGELQGRYRIEENIPEGLELAYVKYYWAGSGYSGTNIDEPKSLRMASNELPTMDGNWNEFSRYCIYNVGYKGSKCDFYYYTNGQKVIWDIDGLVKGDQKDNYGVEFQVACRVTDPDVLLGGITKDFNNEVKLTRDDGRTVGTFSDSVKISKTTLTKTGQYDSGVYQFTIKANQSAEDLVPNADKITLIDEMSDTLIWTLHLSR